MRGGQKLHSVDAPLEGGENNFRQHTLYLGDCKEKMVQFFFEKMDRHRGAPKRYTRVLALARPHSTRAYPCLRRSFGR